MPLSSMILYLAVYWALVSIGCISTRKLSDSIGQMHAQAGKSSCPIRFLVAHSVLQQHENRRNKYKKLSFGGVVMGSKASHIRRQMRWIDSTPYNPAPLLSSRQSLRAFVGWKGRNQDHILSPSVLLSGSKTSSSIIPPVLFLPLTFNLKSDFLVPTKINNHVYHPHPLTGTRTIDFKFYLTI